MANYNQPFQQPVEEEEFDETFSIYTQQPVVKKEEEYFDETFSIYTQPSIQVQPEEEFDETFAFAGEPSTTQPPPSSPRKLSQRELYADPEFQRVLEFYMRKVGSNEDFFEHMRDAEWNLGSAAMRAYQSGSWDDETKAAYSYLRDRFHNTKLQGAQEWFQFFKNAGADVLTDPANFAALLFAIPSFGTSAAIRTAAGEASKQALKRFTTAGLSKKTIEELASTLPKSLIGPARKEMAKRTALYGTVEGGAWTGLYDYLAQSTDINIDPTKDEIDWGQVGLSTAMGATIVGGLGAGMGAISGRKYLQKEFDFSNEAAILRARDDQVRLGKVDADTTNLLNANAKFGADDPTITPKWKLAQRFLGATVGKSTTPFKGPAQGSQTLQELLSKLRYDWDWTLTGAKRAGETLATFGEDLGRRQGRYLFRLERSLNELYREGWFANLSQKDNKHLIALLRNKYRKSIDGEEVSPEVRKAAAQIRPILNDLFEEGKDLKLFSEFQQIADYVPRRFQYDKVKNGQKKLRALVIKYGLADPITETEKKKGILASGKEVDVVLKEQGNVDQEVFGEAANEWLEAYAKGDIDRARELKATKIVDDMIEARWTPHELNTGNSGQGYGFLRTRPFHAIPDEELAEFLEDDIEKLLKDYIINASAAITRTKFFGKTRKDFETNYMTPIREELQASGMVDDEVGKVLAALRNMHGKVTGIDHLFIKNKYARHGMEWTKLSQQMAHLPLATLSSVTEPLILLSRVGIEDVPYAVGQIGNALVKETTKMFDRTARGLRRGVLRQKVKGRGKDLNQEEWMDLYQTGLALEQATMERIEGMFGTSFHGRHARGLQNFFFKSNLLTQWTSAVQLASFTTGKRLIRSNAKKLFENQHGTKLISRTKQKYYEEQLRDLGLNVDETIAWYRRSLRKGEFDETLAKQIEIKKGVKFYQENINNAANRFTKEIILNPSTSEANRPLWFSDPSVNILVQFAGYPTVFNNTILKRFVNETYRYPFQVAPKVAMTTLLMTSVALMGNYIRTVGLQQNPERWYRDSPGVRIADAVRRWGGFGPLDYAQRYMEQGERGSGLFATSIKSVTGPAFQDLVDGIQYRKGPFETGINNLPYLNSFIPSEAKKRIAKAGRDIDKVLPLLPEKKQIDKKPVRTRKKPYDKGGYVTNVDNASPEPEEKKVRGQPFTYAELGGVLAQDVEDRRGFMRGGISRLSKKALDVIRKHRTKLATEQSEESLNVKEIDNLLDPKNDFTIQKFEQTEKILKDNLKESLGTKDVDRRMRTLYPELYDIARSDITPPHILYERGFLRRTPEREAELEAIRKKGLKKSRVTELEQLSGFGESDIIAQESFLGKDLDVGLVKSKYASKNPPTKKTKEALSELLDEYESIGMFDSIDEKKYYLSLYTKKMDGEHWSLPIKIAYQRLHSIAKLAGKNKEEALDQLHEMLEAASQRFAEGGRVGFSSGSTPLTFNQKYHRDTIGMGAVLEENGKPVTVRSIGITHNDLFYNVPSYDRNGGYFTPEEAKKKFLLSIAIGDIQGYETAEEADIAAQLEHQMMMNESEEALKAVGFHGKTPWQQIGEGFQAGKEALGLDFSEGGLVEDMDRLGFAKGGLQKRREARQQELYEKGYSRFMNWFVDSFTPFGMIGGISNLSDVDADRFPRLHNLGVQAGKLYDTAGTAAKRALTIREGESRYDERGFLKDSDSYETDYDELYSQMQAMSSPQQESGLFGGIGRKGRQARRAARRAEEENWFERITGEITDDTRYAMRDRNTLLGNLAARAGPRNPYTSLATRGGDKSLERTTSRGDDEREANIAASYAAHRRVHYAEGGSADLDVLLDDLKTAYDSLSPEEESELQRMIGGREGFNEGGQFVRGPFDKEEYYKRKDELEEHIRKNRLVSKEAQMSLLSGEGYRDPRFIATTGHPLIDKWGLHPLAPDTSGQVLSAKQMGFDTGRDDWLDKSSGLGAYTTGAYLPSKDIMRWQSGTYEADPRYYSPENTQIHEIIHRAAKRSGWDEKKWNRLKERLPLEYKPWIYNNKTDKFRTNFEPFFDEAMTEALTHRLMGGKLSDPELQSQIRFRVRNELQKEEHEPDGLAEKEIPKLVPHLIKDFESYLQELEE